MIINEFSEIVVKEDGNCELAIYCDDVNKLCLYPFNNGGSCDGCPLEINGGKDE